MWNAVYGLIVKVYLIDFKLRRRIDRGYEVLQVFVVAFEKNCPENGENGGHRKRTSVILIRPNLIGSGSKEEMFEPGQRGKASDHHFR